MAGNPTTTRWVLTHDHPFDVPRISPDIDQYGLPSVQCWEKDIGTAEPVLPSVIDEVPALVEDRKQQEHVVEEARVENEYRHAGLFSPARGKPLDERRVIGRVSDGVVRTTFTVTNSEDIDFTRDGRPYNKRTGNPVIPLEEAQAIIQRGRRK
jgi:hypothetical protein